jgi:hypothetical protein
MKVRIVNKDLFSEPIIVNDLQIVVLTDDFDQPLFVASKVADRGIWLMSADDPNFADAIKKLGVSTREAKVVSLDEFVQRPPNKQINGVKE